MDHTIKGVSFRVSGLQAAISNSRRANGCEMLAEASWSAVRALAGAEVPGLGIVLDVGVPRVDPVPAGTRLNLVTAAGA